ncbi:MAG TPA: glycosyltransferase [Terriglobia bacterium]|nr:glycosyltransferase [Terriglobia bacterium]
MRICYLTLGFPPAAGLGGAVTNACCLTTSLAAKGHQVTVCCTNLADKYTRLFAGTRRVEHRGVDVMYFHTHKIFPLGRDSFGLFVCQDFVTFCRDNLPQFDLVHVDGYRDFLTLVATHYCRRYGIPYVIQPRGSIEPAFSSVAAKRLFDVSLGRVILRGSSLFIASSRRERRQQENVIPPGQQVVCIANGIDTTPYRDLPERGAFRQRHGITASLLISYLGRVHPIKGIDILIRAFAAAEGRGRAVLAVIGPDEGYSWRLKALAEELGVSESVVFSGEVQGRQKLEAYVDSDVVVYASRSESFGMVAFEATLCGVPVISSRDSGCGELLAGLGIGFLTDYGDVSMLSHVIDYVVMHRHEIAPRVARARDEIGRAFSWDQIASAYERAYESVLKKRSASSSFQNAIAVRPIYEGTQSIVTARGGKRHLLGPPPVE